jgi:hypothetical protein
MNRLRFPLLLALLAGLFTFFKVPLASSQGVTVLAAQVSEALPVSDPQAATWQTATAVEVPLSAQNITKPMFATARVKAITVRALYNATDIAFLVEWADDTQNDSMVRVQDFRDAVALQFPLGEGQPFFCMGQVGGNVNIWHWKADWQADMAARQDMETLYPNMNVDFYPFANTALPGPGDYADPNYVPALAAGNLFAAGHTSPVEDLIAGGFGSLTAQVAAAQNVSGYGLWANGKWQVIFTRPLASKETEDVQLSAGKQYAFALAAWDGANDERNGMKSTSQWVTLQVGEPATNAGTVETVQKPYDFSGMLFLGVPMLLVALAMLGLAGAAMILANFSKSK